jgi:hypothetical protein
MIPSKGGAGVGTTKRGTGSKIMAIADRHGRPANHVDSATPHEVTLVEATLAHRLVRKTPERLIGDNAYDLTSSMRSSRSAASNSSRLTAATAHAGPRMVGQFPGHVALACRLILLLVFMR